MQPTYSISEIKLLLRSIDADAIGILGDLFEEEKHLYQAAEIKAFYKFIVLHKKANVANEVKADFLLSYN